VRHHAPRMAIAVCALAAVMTSHESPAAPATLTLAEALSLTRRANPSIRVADAQASSSQARLGDAGRRANPTLTVTHDNFGGGLGGGRAETGFSLTQPLGLGGARAAARGRSLAEAEAARASAALVEREEVARTADLFLDAWVIQEKLLQVRQAELVSGQAVAAAAERARVGAGAPHERLRAETALGVRTLERRKLEAAFEGARRRLSIQWGAPLDPPDTLRLPESLPLEPPPVDSLFSSLDRHPAYRRAVAERVAAGWRVREAGALTAFDVGVELGVKRLAEADATGFTAGLTTSLPVLNRYRGSKQSAAFEEIASAEGSAVVAAGLRSEVASTHRALLAALAAWKEADAGILPAAQEALRLVTAGFRAGRLSHLELLEGERGVLEANLLRLEQRADAWRAATRLELLANEPPRALDLNGEESR
jgi:cobalt-zinc-cadmium efflux system outer membrane protein